MNSNSSENQVPRFIDAHHHLWDLQAVHYPWLMETGKRRFFGDPTPIQRNYLASDFGAESDRWRPAASIHVQVGASDALAETQWLARQAPYPQGLVAFCDLADTAAPEQLDQQQAYRQLVGVRQILGRHADEDAVHGTQALLGNPTWRRNLAALAERQLRFDLQMTPTQVAEVRRALPADAALGIALCHAGSPWDQSSEGLKSWQQGLRELARYEPMICKISGLAMFNPDWQRDKIQEVIQRAIDVFGPSRIAFGSNFPVDKLYVQYDTVWDSYAEALTPFSAAERDAMLYGNAFRFYGLG